MLRYFRRATAGFGSPGTTSSRRALFTNMVNRFISWAIRLFYVCE
jgi:hypothetical protein